MNKRKKGVPDFPAIPFDEAIARLLQTDPKEIADLAEEVKRKDEKVSCYVEERRQSIRKGARRSKKRFGI